MAVKERMSYQYTVLVVDDDPNNLEILMRHLGKHGYFVITAPCGSIALDMLKIVVPDVILLDFQMPDLNGLETLRLIREKNKRSVIIIMTAFATNEIEIESILSEADEFMPKPLPFQKIGRKLIAHIIKRRKLYPIRMEVPVEKKIISYFLILKETLPVFTYGSWGSTIRSTKERTEIVNEEAVDDEVLVSGLLSALQSFTTEIFGEEIEHMSMGNFHIIMHQEHKSGFSLCAILSTSTYLWLSENHLDFNIIEALKRIGSMLEGVEIKPTDRKDQYLPLAIQERIKELISEAEQNIFVSRGTSDHQ